MDGSDFDDLSKRVGHALSRRRALWSLGGVLGALVGGASTPEEAEAHNTLKKCKKLKGRKKKACLKKAKKHAAKHANETPPPPGGDQAPPCTADSCPLPPQCSQQVLDDCTAAQQETWLAEAEPCRSACEDPNAAACRDCLTPIAEGWIPEAETCVYQACEAAPAARQTTAEPSTTQVRQESTAHAGGPVTAQSWWNRKCSSPCCYADYTECEEDARDEFLVCIIPAAAAAWAAPIGAAAFIGCVAKLAYETERCDARYGCVDGGSCREGDICCASSLAQLCNGQCCRVPPGKRLDDVCCNGPGGLTCCNQGASCCNGHCLGDHAGPWTPCGTTCCGPDQECCSGQCRPKAQGPWKSCPTSSWPSQCCDGTEECCNGVCRKTAEGPWTPCGETCCDPDHECCNSSCRSKLFSPWTPCCGLYTCCEKGFVCRDCRCEYEPS